MPGERIQATADDAAATHALILECSNWLRIKGVQQWNPVYPRQRFDDDVSEGKVWIWRSRDGVDATVTLSSSRPDYYPPHIWQDTATGWYVCRFAVARRLKSTRLGVRLLVELERDAVAAGIAVLRLDVTASNRFLVRYYTERGFEVGDLGEIMGCTSIFLQKLLA